MGSCSRIAADRRRRLGCGMAGVLPSLALGEGYERRSQGCCPALPGQPRRTRRYSRRRPRSWFLKVPCRSARPPRQSRGVVDRNAYNAHYDTRRMPRMLRIVGVGAILGFLGAVGIYFAPEEPYPGYITLAGTLSGVTIALLMSAAVTRDSSLGRCFAWGACMGLLDSAAVFLAKGAGELGCPICRADRSSDRHDPRTYGPLAAPECHLTGG